MWSLARRDPSPVYGSLGPEQVVFQSIDLLPTILRPYLVVFAAAVGFSAIVGERSNGTLRVLFGTPLTRTELVLAKVCSRSLGTILALTPLVAVSGTVLLVRNGQLPVVAFLTVWGWIASVTLAWTLLAVGVSAATSSRYRSLAVILVVYVVFSPVVNVWSAVVEPVAALAITGSTELPLLERGVTEPVWYEYVVRLNPTISVTVVGSWLLSLVSPVEYPGPVGPSVLGMVSIAVLAVVPVVLGVRWFRRADLT